VLWRSQYVKLPGVLTTTSHDTKTLDKIKLDSSEFLTKVEFCNFLIYFDEYNIQFLKFDI
jgi:hypothetical protein